MNEQIIGFSGNGWSIIKNGEYWLAEKTVNEKDISFAHYDMAKLWDLIDFFDSLFWFVKRNKR